MPLQFRPRLIAGLSLTRDVSSFGRESRAGETKIRQTIDKRDSPDCGSSIRIEITFDSCRRIARRNAQTFLRCARSTITFTYFTAFRCVSRAQENDRLGDKSCNQRSSNKERSQRSGRSGSEVTQLKRNPTMTNHSVNKSSISNRCNVPR